MGVTQNSYIPRAWEVSDLKVSGATAPLTFNFPRTWYITITCNMVVTMPITRLFAALLQQP